MMQTPRTLLAACLVALTVSTTLEAQVRFHATGLSSPIIMEPHLQSVVDVRFDLLPTSMRFNAPSYPCLVTENGIQYSNGFAETYDPRRDPGAKETSFEPGFDDDNIYSRMWIESQHDARIVVRVRGALVSDEGKHIAHADIPSGSPYGEGDWVDEWYTIYPDGVHARHVKIYTGLAARSLPFSSNREPPRVIHEFMEAIVLGTEGHAPPDDIETNAITLIKTIGNFSEEVLPEGLNKTFLSKPYPRDFGEFRNANIMVVNLKSQYKPFTIAMPYGVQTQPYKRNNPLLEGFQVWGPGEHRSYTVPFGHLINYGHYRKTANTLEQVYLSGMIDSKDPSKKLVPLAWSWIVPPQASVEGEESSYLIEHYDPAQKSYVFDWKPDQSELEFELVADADYYGVTSEILNPAIVVKGFGNNPVELVIDDKPIKPNKDLRFGYETTAAGTNLVMWLKLESKDPVNFSIRKRQSDQP